MPFPVVDVFAGPGGLGEGFLSLRDRRKRKKFAHALSIENERNAFDTLHLRHFLHSFKDDEIPVEYYEYIKGHIQLSELYSKYPINQRRANRSTFCVSLTPRNRALIRSKIRERVGKRKRWVLIGGPPCQVYSLVGRARMANSPNYGNDLRHYLYREYLQIIADHSPPVFVMENVKGLLSAKADGIEVLRRLVSDLINPSSATKGSRSGVRYNLYSLTQTKVVCEGEDPSAFLVHSENYGVPQTRHRIFIVGVRSDVKVAPPTLESRTAPPLKDVIGNLPRIRSGLSRGNDSVDAWLHALKEMDCRSASCVLNDVALRQRLFKQLNKYSSWNSSRLALASTRYPSKRVSTCDVSDVIYDPRLEFLDGHESRRHIAGDVQRYAFASSFAKIVGRSPKLADFPLDLLPAHRNVAQGLAGSMFADRFRVQLADELAKTVTAHISKDGHYYIHYDPMQSRSLTVREAARIQTFPDSYKFQGTRTSQFHQIGNAVPPYLAMQIAESVGWVLDQAI